MTRAPTCADLTGGFPPASAEQWRHLVEKTLDGADFETVFEKRLVSHSSDGIRIAPLYMQAVRQHRLAGARAGQPWGIGQRIDHPNPVAANRLALGDLEGGATLLSLVTPGALGARDYGVMVNTIEDLAQLFAGINLEMIELHLATSPDGKALTALLTAFLLKYGTQADKLHINPGLAPITALLCNGSLTASKDALMADLATTAADLRGHGFSGQLICCDTRLIHEAGGSEAQELAVALAMGAEYLRGLIKHGHSLAEATGMLSWMLTTDADQFIGVAKLRALRLLWMRVEQASGLPHQPIYIHAETAWRMMSRRDPAVNILRTTLAAAVASFGGADSVTVLPYTLPLGLPDESARRLARNTQIVLADEANLWRVADPAAGAGAYETLTDDLCRVAWALFQEIEAEGGIIESFQAGHLQARIAVVRAERAEQIARRKIPLTGTSEFPYLSEQDNQLLDVAPPAQVIPTARRRTDSALQIIEFSELVMRFSSGFSMTEALQPSKRAIVIAGTALPSLRLSEPFEALRDAADRHEKATGKRAIVFVANLGASADHGPRASWIRNLLAAGGINATSSSGFTNPSDALGAFAASDTDVVCICGKDAAYAELAEVTAQAFKKAGAQNIYVAGHPGNFEQPLRNAGVDGFLFAGIDILAALSEIHTLLGVRN